MTTKMAKKTDNHNPEVKLDLRRYMLRKYHPGGCHVLECCQGSGILWTQLKKEFDVKSLVGVDVKPKPGRIRAESSRLLDQPGWMQDVIDVDTYGEPWKHYAAICRHIDRDITVFLTWGCTTTGGGSKLGNSVRQSLRIPDEWSLSPAMTTSLNGIATPFLLRQACGNATIAEAVEAFPSGNARYLAVRLETKKPDGAETPSGEHTRSAKGN